MNQNICAMCAERIIKQLDAGVVPWKKPWVIAGGAKSYATGQPYSILNQVLVERCGEYATFKQIQEAGAKIKKGAKSEKIVFWKVLSYGPECIVDDDGDVLISLRGGKNIPYLRYYNVFHLDDVEGLEPKHPDDETTLPNSVTPEEQAESIWRSYAEREGIGLHVDELRPHAFYCPSKDYIELPDISQFTGKAEYYSTVYHEVVHSTGHRKRLGRDLSGRKGSKSYAIEELVAEIGACSMLAFLNLETKDSFENNAAYIRGWRNKIAEDNTLVVTAAGRAQKALDLIRGIKRDVASEN